MKKIIFVIIFIFIFLISGNIGEAKVIIPDEAIRLRVIPNSDSEYDQQIKTKVKNKLQSDVLTLLKDTSDIKTARKIIDDNLLTIDQKINKLLENENYELGYDINYGYNYFPKKVYKGVTYEEGYYESLVITLGQGKGSNWWCVLFPPLCLMEAEENEDIEYASFVEEIINKYK